MIHSKLQPRILCILRESPKKKKNTRAIIKQWTNMKFWGMVPAKGGFAIGWGRFWLRNQWSSRLGSSRRPKFLIFYLSECAPPILVYYYISMPRAELTSYPLLFFIEKMGRGLIYNSRWAIVSVVQNLSLFFSFSRF